MTRAMTEVRAEWYASAAWAAVASAVRSLKVAQASTASSKASNCCSAAFRMLVASSSRPAALRAWNGWEAAA
jgi:hypothetical protein